MRERRIDGERLARLEEKMGNVSDTIDLIRTDVQGLVISRAQDSGMRNAIHYITNGVAGMGGIIVGYLGLKHGG